MNCELVEPFSFNGRFAPVVGAEFFRDGELRFVNFAPRADGSYRTHFGPCISHNAVVYADNSHNLSLALRRLTGEREPEQPGADALLRTAQEDFIARNLGVFDELRHMYAPYFEDYLGAYEEARVHHADPHEKKMLRIAAWSEIEEKNTPFSTDLPIRSVRVKQKPIEYAKPGKKPRCIGDLGVAASLQGFRLTHFLKTAQDGVAFEYRGGTAVFVKSPDPHRLEEAFLNLITPPGRAYFVYFSDDSCLSMRHGAAVHLFNLDIKSCDASHTDSLFDLLEYIIPEGLAKDDIQLLTRQCGLPIRLVCKEDPRLVVILRSVCRVLFSGSVLTTAINNLANLLIFISIMQGDYDPTLVEGECVYINAAARRAGYLLSGTTPLGCPEELQFLKNSPVLDVTGVYRPMLNFGVLLRAMGTCHGDLPGRGELKPRAEAFSRGLLRGCYPFTSSDLTDAMWDTLGSGSEVLDRHTVESLAFKVEAASGYPTYRVDPLSFARRYKLDAVDYTELLETVCRLRFGEHYSGPCVNAILDVDYGLTSVEYGAGEYLNVAYPVDGLEALP